MQGTKSFAHIMVGSMWHLGSSGEIVEQEQFGFRQEFCMSLGS